eukprot:TRINITY_DN7299_c0_g1_i1.p1 TRINITY_DN7299_c0_g1~~TRINITY_DN7299_c0_g1_i1.p1  ORF type:complete len:354 (+),score=45.10 TRINITY_DN7299_c0_g1_i1:105-1166(+)
MIRILFLFASLLLVLGTVEIGNKINVFSADEGGYFCIKIPDLLVTQNSTLIAFGEGRRESCSDFTWTDLVIKRSFDGGRSWGPLTILFSNSTPAIHVVIGNAAPVQIKSGRILVPFCRNNFQVFLTYSDDDGLTWSNPIEIKDAVRPHWTWVGTGPPAALQLSTGRIIVPAYHSFTPNDDGEISYGHTLISDDEGKTWRIAGETDTKFPLFRSNECQAVEPFRNGSVWINARGLGTARLRLSLPDSGETVESVELISGLPEPLGGCEGSTVQSGSNFYFSGPAERSILRFNMTLFMSSDFLVWQRLAVIDAGPSAYSALVTLANGSLALLYERSTNQSLIFVPQHISFVVIAM